MTQLKQIPTEQEMQSLIGTDRYSAWKGICRVIDSIYDMECQWNDGGKKWKYEYKYRRGGKTLCALYAKQDCLGLMIIFGKEEREKVNTIRSSLSSRTLEVFDSATTYHDGKWAMFDETIPMDDMKILLNIKRRPNKKAK